VAITPTGPGIPPSSKLSDRSPIAVAGAVLIATQAIMTAFWSAVADAFPAFPLTEGTEGLISTAVVAVVTVGALIWLDHKTTPVGNPVLPENTTVGVTNGSSKVVATATLPAAADALTAAPQEVLRNG
jgi:hypothetical protein